MYCLPHEAGLNGGLAYGLKANVKITPTRVVSAYTEKLLDESRPVHLRNEYQQWNSITGITNVQQQAKRIIGFTDQGVGIGHDIPISNECLPGLSSLCTSLPH